MALTKGNSRMIDGAAVNVRDFGAVGDGVTDDTAAIQAALDFCRDNPGYEVCEVPPSVTGGPYIFTMLKVYSQTTFKGTGGVLKYKDGTVTDPAASYYPIHNLGEDRVVYDGLIVEGNSAGNPIRPVVCDIITAVGFRTEVINCKLFNAVDSSIIFSATQRGRCQNNYFEGANDVCIYINASSGSVINEAIVSGNVCKDATFGGIALKREVENIIVSNNTIVDCGNGITVEDFGSGVYPKNVQILDNEIRDIGYTHRGVNVAERGISISELDDSIISGNKISNCSGDCLLLAGVRNTVVTGNHIKGYTADPASTGNNGIYDGTVQNDNLVVSNNHISGMANRGIYFTNLKNSSITGNNMKDTGSSTLRLNAGCQGNVVSHNVIMGTTPTEIFAGVVSIIKDNSYPDLPTEFSKVGIRTVSSGQPLPPGGTMVPFYTGEVVVHLAANQYFKATGIAAGEWSAIS